MGSGKLTIALRATTLLAWPGWALASDAGTASAGDAGSGEIIVTPLKPAQRLSDGGVTIAAGATEHLAAAGGIDALKHEPTSSPVWICKVC